MKFAAAILAALLAFAAPAATEQWEFKAVMLLPLVENNTSSCGQRVFRRCRLVGCVTVEKAPGDEPRIAFCSLRNLDHLVGGREVSYSVSVDADATQWHILGNNSSGIFDRPAVALTIAANPSYAPGTEPTEDNSLYLTLAGRGTTTALTGYCAGQMGCACGYYGHISPTRIWDGNQRTVTDIAGCFGRWKMRRVK